MATLQTTAVTGSLTVTGQLIAQSLNVQQVTSSIVYSSGSNIFGKLVTDVQQLTGSLRVTGSGEHWIMGGNVGIGTTDPTATLHLRAASPYIYFDDTSTSGTLSRFKLIAGDVGVVQTATFGFDNTSGTANKDVLSINEGGNVGIGTNSPNALLHIWQSGGNTQLRVGNNSTYDQFIYFNGNSDWSIGMDYSNSNAFVISSNSSLGTNDRFIITTAGQVIMGAANSSLTRNASVVGTTGFSVQYDNNSGTYLDIIPNIADSTVDIKASKLTGAFPPMTFHTSGSERMRLTTDGRLILKSTTPGGGTQAEFYIIENGGFVIDSSEGATQRYIEFTTGGTSKMLIKADGNVGIGTTSPTSKLHIIYPGDNAAGFRLQGDATDNTLEFRTNGDIAHIQAYTASAFTTGASLALNAAGGNIGIGTTSPAQKLDVVGKIRATDDLILAQANPVIEFDNGSTGALRFYSLSGSTERMRVQSNGNVGIGTTAPAVTLQVDASGGGLIRATRTSAGSGYIQMEADGTNGTLTANNILYFNAGGGTKMTVLSDGNVGIGTTSPNTKLRVIGGGSTFQFVLKLAKSSYADTGGHTTLIGLGCEDATWSRSAIGHTRNNSYDVGYLGFYVSNNTSDGSELVASDLRMLIKADGNVGIGTASPGAKLDISGNAIITNVSGSGNFLTIKSTTGNYGGQIDFYENSLLSHAIGSTGANNTFFIKDEYNNATRILINNVGNIGIGTTTPTGKLHVSQSGNGAATTLILSDNARQLKLGRDQIQAYDLSNSATTMYISPDANVYVNVSSGFTYFGGSIGIGTTSPSAPLQIRDSSVSSGGSAIHAYGFDGAANFYTSRGEDPYNAALYLYNNPSAGQGYGTGILFRAKSDTTVSQVQGAIYTTWTTATDASRTSKMVFSTVNSGTNSDKVTILGNGNVGIGTTSPGSLLQVNGKTVVGSDSSNALEVFSNGDTEIGFSYATRGNIYAKIIGDVTDASPLGGEIAFQTATGGTLYERMRVTKAGNVGIGTTSPTTTLHVRTDTGVLIRGASSDSDAILSFLPASGGRQYNFRNYGSSFGIQDSSADNIRMYFHFNGNTGIGNTSPITKLHVNNTVAGAILPYIQGTGLSYNNEGISVAGSNTNNTNIGNGLTLYNNVASVGAYGPVVAWSSMTVGGAYNATYAFITGEYRGAGGDNNWSRGDLIFGTGDTYGATERMRIKDSGNVGIGTTSPAYKLDIAVAQSIRVRGSSTGYTQGSIIFQSSTTDTPEARGLGVYAFNEGTDATWFYGTAYNAADSFVVNRKAGTTYQDAAASVGESSTFLLVNNAGNVGIGTSAPSQLLHVFNSSADAERGIRIANANAGTSADASLRIDGYAGSYIDFYRNTGFRWRFQRIAFSDDFKITADTGNGGAGDVMYFDYDTGRVGIGTTSPAAILDVTGNAVDFVIPATSTLPTAVPFTINSSGTARNMTGNAGGYSFGDNTMLSLIAGDDVQTHLGLWRASDAATGANAGSRLVGFGSRGSMAAPASVGDDDVIFSLEGWAIHGSGPNKAKFGAGMRFVKDDDFGTASTYAPQRTEFYNAVNTTTIQTNVVILPNGNVGIGTTSPAAKLDVIGIVRSYSNGGNYGQISNGSFQAVGDHGGTFMIDVDNTGAADLVNIKKSGSSRFYIKNDGNVGIGTTSPTVKLHVNDSSHSRLAIRIEAPAVSNTAGRWTGIGLSGEEANTKGGILFESLGTSYSRGKIHIAINNAADQTNVTIADAILTAIPDGNVGIGSTSPVYKLDVSGTIRATGDVIAYSDARVKENINSIDAPLDLITKLRGVTYTRKDTDDKSRKVGVIAQEVLPILPEVVQKDTNGNYSVAYGNIVGVLIEAIKELKAEIDILKNK